MMEIKILGFGHIAFRVPNVQKACERFEKLGVTFQKKPEDGRMSNITLSKIQMDLD